MTTTPEPSGANLSRLHRLRRYVNRGGEAQRRLELGMAAVVSGVILVIAEAFCPPRPLPAAASVEQPTAPPSAPPSCDEPATMAKFITWIGGFEERGVSPASLGGERLETYVACARREAEGAGRTATLQEAARSGRARTVRWFLGAAPVRARELDEAVLGADAHPAIVAMLRAKGAGAPGLVEAARRQAPNAVRAALAAPHDRAELSTALSSLVANDARCAQCDARAYATEQVRAVGMLLAKGAEIDGDGLAGLCARGSEMIDAHLATALVQRRPGAIEGALGNLPATVPEPVVRRIAAEGIDWAYRDGEDDAPMPLVRAVANRNEQLVRLLVELGAPVERVYRDGSSALESAVSCAEGETACGRITELLLERGADPNRRFPDGSTPLFAAAESGNGRVVRALIDGGARLETKVLRETPLDAAERSGNTLAARILAARGARVSPLSGYR